MTFNFLRNRKNLANEREQKLEIRLGFKNGEHCSEDSESVRISGCQIT